MEKVLICLEVPAVQGHYEVKVPDFLPVRQLLPLMIQAAGELSGGLYVSSGSEILCVKGRDYVLDEDASLDQYDITAGDHLVLL